MAAIILEPVSTQSQIDTLCAIAKTVWIDPDTMAPVCAELYCDGDKQLTLYFEQFQ